MQLIEKADILGKALENEFDGQMEGTIFYGHPLTIRLELSVKNTRVLVDFILNGNDPCERDVDEAVEKVRRKINNL